MPVPKAGQLKRSLPFVSRIPQTASVRLRRRAREVASSGSADPDYAADFSGNMQKAMQTNYSEKAQRPVIGCFGVAFALTPDHRLRRREDGRINAPKSSPAEGVAIMALDNDVFRAIVGSFPTGVTVVTTADADGTPRGLTSNAFCWVSSAPELILVCVDKGSTTLEVLRSAKSFVVNFLSEGREYLSNRFASKEADKFGGLNWSASAIAKGAPILVDDVIAFAECLTEQEIEAGDHWILVGRVHDGDVISHRPLMYYRRQYGAWPHGPSCRSVAAA